MAKTPPSHSTIDLVPWAVNHSLTEAEQRALEETLRQQPDYARGLNNAWQHVRTAALSQGQQAPAPAVRQRLLALVRAQRAQTQFKTLPRWRPLLSGVILTLLTLAVLWNVVQPGIGLQWSVNGAVPSAFRVYRAPLGSDRFEIVREVPARANTLDYSFIDTTLWPGQTYQYRVEVVNANTTSATVAANGAAVLPMQLAIVFSSVLIGFAGAYVLRETITLPKASYWKAV